MKVKNDIPIEFANRIINAGPVILLTASHNGATTVSTIAWHMPASKSPMLFAVSISNSGYSLELLAGSKAFCLNLPDYSLVDKVRYCGVHSGRDVDKFMMAGLTPVNCRAVPTFYVEECIAHAECSVEEIHQAGDHKLIIGKVLDAYCDEFVFDKNNVIDLNRIKLIHHLGGVHFCETKTL